MWDDQWYTIAINQPNPHDYKAAYALLRHPLSPLYPNFCRWYLTKVIDGCRPLILTRLRNHLVGVAILKPESKKICTIYVDEPYRHRGIGTDLLTTCCTVLNTATPLITVPASISSQFERLFDSFGFKHTSSLEAGDLVFNEPHSSPMLNSSSC